MQFIRAFWGDLNKFGQKYKKQILSVSTDNLNEVVYVWGLDNFNFIKSIGYNCVLVSEDNYDYNLANNHTFYDYKSLNHKLWIVEYALKEYDEIIFLDWDCKLIKSIDTKFYDYLRNGNDLQVPLYIYPKNSLDWMIEQSPDMEFFSVLKQGVIKYSYDWNEHYVIPNTGFIYCRNKNINLLDISLKNNLQGVPDEFSVLLYAKERGYQLDDYIKNIEPNIILGKEHDLDWWIKIQNNFNDFVKNKIKKQIYFEHI